MKKLLVGIDIGTTGIKVAFYTNHGQLVERAYREYDLSFPEKSWVEINPEVWWGKLGSCMNEIKLRGKINLKEVAGIGITCTNSLILLDKDQQALIPSIMQLDQRSIEQSDNLKRVYGDKRMFSKTGNRISPGSFWGPALQWVRENQPSLYNQAKYFLVPTSFLVLRLTGIYSIDHSRATTTMLYDIHNNRWDSELCEVFGILESNLPPIYKSHEVVGVVNEEGELATGFLTGTPVIAGAMDTIGALVGLGVGPENGALIMGSVGRFCIQSEYLDMRFMNTVNYDAGNHLIMTPVNSAGVSYKWAKNLLFNDYLDSENLYEVMNQMAASIEPGAEGLFYLPYLTGEKAPIWDSHSKGIFLGLSINHNRKHLLRAVLEGVGYALAQNYEILRNELNIDPPYLLAGGGGARSLIWMQIISDILGKPIYIPAELETETMGAAMLVGMGVGLFLNLSDVRNSWNRISEKLTPRLEITDFYRDKLAIFKNIYNNNMGIFKMISGYSNSIMPDEGAYRL